MDNIKNHISLEELFQYKSGMLNKERTAELKKLIEENVIYKDTYNSIADMDMAEISSLTNNINTKVKQRIAKQINSNFTRNIAISLVVAISVLVFAWLYWSNSNDEVGVNQIAEENTESFSIDVQENTKSSDEKTLVATPDKKVRKGKDEQLGSVEPLSRMTNVETDIDSTVGNTSENLNSKGSESYQGKYAQIAILERGLVKENNLKDYTLAYPGGDANLIKAIDGNLKYNKGDEFKKTEGITNVKITINKKGKIKEIILSQHVSPRLDYEIKKAFENLEDWQVIGDNVKSDALIYIFYIKLYYKLEYIPHPSNNRDYGAGNIKY